MKNIIKSGIFLLLCTLIFGLTAFTTDNTIIQSDEVSSCYVYRADLTTAKWQEIASPHGYTQYFIIDPSATGSPTHVISTSDYNGDWSALMNCIGLPPSTASIIIIDDLGGT